MGGAEVLHYWLMSWSVPGLRPSTLQGQLTATRAAFLCLHCCSDQSKTSHHSGFGLRSPWENRGSGRGTQSCHQLICKSAWNVAPNEALGACLTGPRHTH